MTHDEIDGMAWWNALDQEDRRFWMAAACSSVPAEAWAYFKRANPGRVASRPQAVRLGPGEATRGN